MANLTRYFRQSAFVIILLAVGSAAGPAQGKYIAKRPLPKSRLELGRRTQSGSFFDVVGRRSAIFGYEHRGLEAWVYPLKIVSDFELFFQIEGYNLPFRGSDLLTGIEVRPESTTFIYSHAAFSVREIVYAPVDEQGLIILLDIDTRLPMTIDVSFRPNLKLMWAGNMMTPFFGQDEKEKYYFIGEETQKFFGIVGTPGASDASLMPYQEEPRDVPVRYRVNVSPAEAETNFVPIVMSAGTEGRDKAVETYDRLLKNAISLYENNVRYYEDFLDNTTQVTTPDERLNTAYAWAKIGVEKGVATNPFLGTGLLAGFRTSGDSERPGFAWYFGRDSMWTSLAIDSYGDFATTKLALSFLRKFQREDGKIPHEISQSATLIDWWKAYPYAWRSADATPLYIIVQGDYYRTSGDIGFLRDNWGSIQKAYKFSEATDTDGNGLIENTNFGHGWVEGGALYPPHEEIYLQGVWIRASLDLAEMADVLGDKAAADKARGNAERTRSAMEQTYWLGDRGFYAYATQIPPNEPIKAEAGPNIERRQARLNELSKQKLYDEDTVLPAVPMWWRSMQNDERAQKELDHLGSARISTDWGSRILANDSRLYDPLSYHYGSVWGLFTGWQSVAAYNYGRPQIGYRSLMANSLLTYSNALGYVTELLSGDFNAPFGRSSHHQVWSEAMVISPVIRGMLGIEVDDAGRTLKFAPSIPADWDDLAVRGVRAGTALFDIKMTRDEGKMTISVTRRGSGTAPEKLVLAPAFALDARIASVTVGGKPVKFDSRPIGDVQRIEASLFLSDAAVEIVFNYSAGTDVYEVIPMLAAGAENTGLRVIKSQARENGLYLLLEGLAAHNYRLIVRSPRTLLAVDAVTVNSADPGRQELGISFAAADPGYVRREILLPYREAGKPKHRK